MFITMITMCRYDLSQEENNLANNLFEKFIKQVINLKNKNQRDKEIEL